MSVSLPPYEQKCSPSARVLLATIRDGGMCPCPRCLVPKSEMYLMGFVRDISARISKVRKYFGDSVRAARRHIYHSAYAIGSDKVNDVLKQTSSVPTLVSTSLSMDVDRHITSFCIRTHSLNVSVMTSIFTRCSSSTLCTSSNLGCGKICLHT